MDPSHTYPAASDTTLPFSRLALMERERMNDPHLKRGGWPIWGEASKKWERTKVRASCVLWPWKGRKIIITKKKNSNETLVCSGAKQRSRRAVRKPRPSFLSLHRQQHNEICHSTPLHVLVLFFFFGRASSGGRSGASPGPPRLSGV